MMSSDGRWRHLSGTCPKAVCRKVLEELERDGLRPPVFSEKLEGLAEWLGVSIKYSPGSPGGCVRTCLQGPRVTIYVAGVRGVVPKRRLVAHALGHLMLGHISERTQECNGHECRELDRGLTEEAEEFCLELLLPSWELERLLSLHGNDPERLARICRMPVTDVVARIRSKLEGMYAL